MLGRVLGRAAEILKGDLCGVRRNDDGEEVCYYCGGPLESNPIWRGPQGAAYHWDHVFPLSMGGPNGNWNLVLSCASCNLSKRAKHPLVWLTEIELPDAWAVDYLARLLIETLPACKCEEKQPDEPQVYTRREFSGLWPNTPMEPVTTGLLPAFPWGKGLVLAKACPGCGGKLVCELPECFTIVQKCEDCRETSVQLWRDQ